MVRELVEEELSGAPRRALGALGICGLNCPPRCCPRPCPAFAATSGGRQARASEPDQSEHDTDGEDHQPATIPAIGNVTTSPAQPITPEDLHRSGVPAVVALLGECGQIRDQVVDQHAERGERDRSAQVE